MTDTIKDAIIALQGGDSAQFKDAINTELHDRIKQSIELKKVEIAKDLASTPVQDTPVEEPNAEEVTAQYFCFICHDGWVHTKRRA